MTSRYRVCRWSAGWTIALAQLASGCAGALGVYVPGSGNKSGDYQTATPIGNGLAEVKTRHYSIGADGPALALGAKAGRSWGSLGGTSVEPGVAFEAHADLGYTRGRFGWLLSVGFGVDRGYLPDDTEVRYGGLDVGAIGQALLIPRVAAHLGLHRVAWGHVNVGPTSIAASGWGAQPGLDLTMYRGTKNEFIFRVDLRHTRSGDAMMGTQDVSWVGTALLGQLVWVSTP